MDETMRTLEHAAAEVWGDATAALRLALERVRAGAKAAVVTAEARSPKKYRTSGRLYVWSAPGTPELSRRTRIAAARAVLLAIGIDPLAVRLTWSRYAGCSMCPCSPGYIVRAMAMGARVRAMGASDAFPTAFCTYDIRGTVVVPESKPDPKSQMETLRNQLGIPNGGR